ncbi:flavodoxin domain-containing protein [Radiobacillus sp. PE A8.2]|uniref:flavodoxin domain-containing protein n=1 Tax=Radiobacillus sp. PE A8.2 TaxID=3380349 RepID=UPI00388F1D34
MKTAIIYTSITGNTEELVQCIYRFCKHEYGSIDLFPIEAFDTKQLPTYDVVAVGTYSWENGQIPIEMEELFEAFEDKDVSHLITGVFGTGDSFYPYFCGAVDSFRDMLYVHTKLAVTLRVELSPQHEDFEKCKLFSQRLMNSAYQNK